MTNLMTFSPTANPPKRTLSDADLRRWAHLPVMALFYLALQRQMAATPVTPLELSGYLGIPVGMAEKLLEHLESRGVVSRFSSELTAYMLTRSPEHIDFREVVELLLKCQDLAPEFRSELPATPEYSDKYRKLYSELASEILSLFGQNSANSLPI